MYKGCRGDKLEAKRQGWQEQREGGVHGSQSQDWAGPAGGGVLFLRALGSHNRILSRGET